MSKKEIATGVVHGIPTDLRKALLSDESASEKWEDITPLARNEWICWITSPKRPGTRKNHVERTVTELLEGMRRPCCWAGCPHRKDKELSPSQKYVLDKQSKKSA